MCWIPHAGAGKGEALKGCTPAWRQELAFALMRLRQRHPEWWASMQPYWDSLPAPGAVLREHSFPDDLLDLLQDEAMVRARSLQEG